MNNKITIIGADSIRTAVTVMLTAKGHEVPIWGRKKSQLALMKETYENPHYLPGIKLPKELIIVENLEDALKDAEIVVFSVPAQSFRTVFSEAKPFITQDKIVVNVAKGIEKGSLMRLSQIAKEIMPNVDYVTLSGPSHAEEIAKGMPTIVAVASEKKTLSIKIQEAFNTDRFRVYTNDDIIGVELGGALKNIIALGAGISDGMGFGDNAKAAMMTRGITEMSRLGAKLGADMGTLSGLTGIGDLIVTCTSMHSRNRRCGIMIGEGIKPSEATSRVGMVVEGMFTAEAAYELAKKVEIEMPITECIYNVIKEKIDAKDAVDLLMGRDKKNEKHIF